MLKQLSSCNSVPILSVSDAAFGRYGRLVQGYDFDSLLTYMQQQTAVPVEGNCYVASEPGMEALPVAEQLRCGFFGGMPLQIGYCNGNNSKLNCFEYHKSSELDIAVTPLVLLLAHLEELQGNHIQSSNAKAFFLPAGTAVELYSTTLHFSPCKVQDSGFKSVIILPQGTNLPLDFTRTTTTDEDRLLWMRNKWLVALPDTVQAQKKAFVGIDGGNIDIIYQF